LQRLLSQWAVARQCRIKLLRLYLKPQDFSLLPFQGIAAWSGSLIAQCPTFPTCDGLISPIVCPTYELFILTSLHLSSIYFSHQKNASPLSVISMSDSPAARVSRPHGPFIGRDFDFWKRRRQPPFRKTEAELSLLENLQGNNQVAAPTQAKSASVPNTKGPDVKPRLLLMGLRR
jgi:hypothetical protein